jgi:hypothetical protein
MHAFVVCSAAAVIYLVYRCIISCCSHGGEDEEDDPGLSLPYLNYLESSSPNEESYIPESYARTKSIPESARRSIRTSPHDEQLLVTALANKVLSDEGSNVTAEDIRSKARTLKSKWLEALKQGNRAIKKGDRAAVARYKRDVQELRRRLEFLNKVAAKVIFTEKNKVSRLSSQTFRDEMKCPKVGHAKHFFSFRGSRVAPMDWSISTVCTSRKLLNMQSRHFSWPPSGMRKWSALSSVRLPSTGVCCSEARFLMVDSCRTFRQGIACEGWQGENSACFGKPL